MNSQLEEARQKVAELNSNLQNVTHENEDAKKELVEVHGKLEET